MEDKLIGYQWGKRTVIRFSHIRNGNERVFICRCECGAYDEVGIYSINAGRNQQCNSCRVKFTMIINTKHGKSRDRTHKIWRSMIRRCNIPWDKDYPRYGGRGIRVDIRWLDFEEFLKDMGEVSHGLSIDRINGSGNYEPGNCRWATVAEQLGNRTFKDLTGQVIGNRTVIARVKVEGKSGRYYLCRCACGRESIMPAGELNRGKRTGRSKECAQCSAEKRVYKIKPGPKPKAI